MTRYTSEQAESGVLAPKEAVLEEKHFEGVGLRYRYKAVVKLVCALNESENKEVWFYQTSVHYGHDWENPGFKNKGSGSEVNWMLFEARYSTSLTPPFDSLEAIRSAGELYLPSKGGPVDQLVRELYH